MSTANAREILRACTHVIWHDTSFSAGGNALADAACWSCGDAALRTLEAENERLAREHTQVHEWNNQLVAEHYALAERVRGLEEATAIIKRVVRVAGGSTFIPNESDLDAFWEAVRALALAPASPATPPTER